MILQERQQLLNEYADKSRAFSDAVERLRGLNIDAEAFICALNEAGSAHRACERSRIRLNKHLMLGLLSGGLAAQLIRIPLSPHPNRGGGLVESSFKLQEP